MSDTTQPAIDETPNDGIDFGSMWDETPPEEPEPGDLGLTKEEQEALLAESEGDEAEAQVTPETDEQQAADPETQDGDGDDADDDEYVDIAELEFEGDDSADSGAPMTEREKQLQAELEALKAKLAPPAEPTPTQQPPQANQQNQIVIPPQLQNHELLKAAPQYQNILNIRNEYNTRAANAEKAGEHETADFYRNETRRLDLEIERTAPRIQQLAQDFQTKKAQLDARQSVQETATKFRTDMRKQFPSIPMAKTPHIDTALNIVFYNDAYFSEFEAAYNKNDTEAIDKVLRKAVFGNEVGPRKVRRKNAQTTPNNERSAGLNVSGAPGGAPAAKPRPNASGSKVVYTPKEIAKLKSMGFTKDEMLESIKGGVHLLK